jgi:DNA-binding transcriptional LysR family regulator
MEKSRQIVLLLEQIAMMDLNEIQYFRHVAELGSFSQASRQLGIPKSTLSRKVSDLEKRLGVSLLRRTTRQVQLTEVGQDYLKLCKEAFLKLEGAEAIASQAETKAQGTLRIAAPLDIASLFLAAVSRDFLAAYPEIDIEFLLDDRIVDLIEDKVDLAVRAGALPDSSLKAHRLGFSEFQLFASPEYLKRYGEPKTPKDLEKHRCIVFTNLHKDKIWPLTSKDGGKQRIHVKNAVLSNQLGMVKTLTIEGAGIGLLPVFQGLETEPKKEWVRILKNWGMDREPLHAVYPVQPYMPLRTRLFLDFLKKAFRS